MPDWQAADSLSRRRPVPRFCSAALLVVLVVAEVCAEKEVLRKQRVPEVL